MSKTLKALERAKEEERKRLAREVKRINALINEIKRARHAKATAKKTGKLTASPMPKDAAP